MWWTPVRLPAECLLPLVVSAHNSVPHRGGGSVDKGANPTATPDWCLKVLCQLGPFLCLAQIHTDDLTAALDVILHANFLGDTTLVEEHWEKERFPRICDSYIKIVNSVPATTPLHTQSHSVRACLSAVHLLPAGVLPVERFSDNKDSGSIWPFDQVMSETCNGFSNWKNEPSL